MSQYLEQNIGTVMLYLTSVHFHTLVFYSLHGYNYQGPAKDRIFQTFCFREFQNSSVIKIWNFFGNIWSFQTHKNFAKIVWK